MNATQRLIDAVEEVFRLSQLDYDGIDILVQRAAANQEVKEALAAAKEEQGKVLTMQDVMLACGELNKRERVAVQWVLDRCRPVKEDQNDPYRPRFRSAVSGLWYTDPKAAGDIDIAEVGGVKFFPPGEIKEGQVKALTDERCMEIEEAWQQAHGADITHTMAFSDGLATARDYLAPAKGSGLTVEGAVAAVMSVWEGARFHSAAHNVEADIRKALEDRAENSSDNLRTDPWISVEDRLPNDKVRVLAWGNDWHRVGDCYLEVGDDGHATWMWFDDDDPVRHGNVTHWMPLPAPPDNTTP